MFRAAADWLYQNQDADKFYLVVDAFDPHESWGPREYYRRMYDPEDEGVPTGIAGQPCFWTVGAHKSQACGALSIFEGVVRRRHWRWVFVPGTEPGTFARRK